MRRWLYAHMYSQRGFTLIELMAVIAILAMIVVIAVPAVGGILKNAEASAKASEAKLVERAAEMAFLGETAFDTGAPEQDAYTVPALVEAGYLNLSDDSPLYNAANYAVKVPDSSTFTLVIGAEVPEEEVVPEANAESDFVTRLYDNNSKVEVMGYKGSTVDVVIPQSFDGIPTVRIAAASFGGDGLTSIYIPDGVTDIRYGAFFETGLTSVRLPPTLKTIGNAAFMSNALTSVQLPPSLTKIDGSAFANNKLERIEIPMSVETLAYEVLVSNPYLTDIVIYNESAGFADYGDVFDGEFVTANGVDYAKQRLHGYTGSTTETYALANGFEFVALD